MESFSLASSMHTVYAINDSKYLRIITSCNPVLLKIIGVNCLYTVYLCMSHLIRVNMGTKKKTIYTKRTPYSLVGAVVVFVLFLHFKSSQRLVCNFNSQHVHSNRTQTLSFHTIILFFFCFFLQFLFHLLFTSFFLSFYFDIAIITESKQINSKHTQSIKISLSTACICQCILFHIFSFILQFLLLSFGMVFLKSSWAWFFMQSTIDDMIEVK